MSLRTKITGVTVLLVTLGLLVAGVGTMTVLRTYLQENLDSKIKATASSGLEVTPAGGTNCTQTTSSDPYFFEVQDATGGYLCSNIPSSGERPTIPSMPIGSTVHIAGSPFTVWDGDHQSQWRVLVLPFQDTTGDFVTVVVGLSLNGNNAIISQFLVIFLGFGLSVIILGAALTRLLVTSTFAPLREVEDTAAAIAEGDFSQRLPGATPNTEVGRLNRSLNLMLNRIDRAFADRARTIDQMRRFVGDASHELRTPLVSVRGYAELYRMGALSTPEEVAQAMERIEKEAIRMGGLVEDLLELARIDEAKPLQLGPVDLVPLARDAALDAMASAPDRDVTVEFIDDRTQQPTDEPANAVAPTVPVRSPAGATGPRAFAGAQLARFRRRPARPSAVQENADVVVSPLAPATHALVLAEENKIRQVITNLMGNAMRFTDDTSPIELVVSVDRVRKVGMLDIVDHGEGIPPQIRDKIFQRFWRADTSRTRETGGSGLGLAIVSGIIASHKGAIEVFETPGGGATFRVILPLLPMMVPPPAVPSGE